MYFAGIRAKTTVHQSTNSSGFDVKTNVRENGPCSANFHSSANQFWEKRFSQSYRVANWQIRLVSYHLEHSWYRDTVRERRRWLFKAITCFDVFFFEYMMVTIISCLMIYSDKMMVLATWMVSHSSWVTLTKVPMSFIILSGW